MTKNEEQDQKKEIFMNAIKHMLMQNVENIGAMASAAYDKGVFDHESVNGKDDLKNIAFLDPQQMHCFMGMALVKESQKWATLVDRKVEKIIQKRLINSKIL